MRQPEYKKKTILSLRKLGPSKSEYLRSLHGNLHGNSFTATCGPAQSAQWSVSKSYCEGAETL